MSPRTKIQNKWQFSIDRGGTFTDIIGFDLSGNVKTFKVLSGNDHYSISPVFETIRKMVGLASNEFLSSKIIEEIRVGTTLGTNALLERRGSKTAFLVTKGYEDILRISHQARASLFNLSIKDRILLYSSCHGIDERINCDGSIITLLDTDRLNKELRQIKLSGIKSIAIAFMHSYKNPSHEIMAKEVALNYSFDHISMSHEVSRLIGFVDRCSTTVFDAYLSPTVRKYVEKLKEFTGDIPLKIMQSNGGLVEASKLKGKNLIFSGPAGGVVGAMETSMRIGRNKIICFDMGGTSTDVSHCLGKMEYRSKIEIEGISIVAPIVDIHTVAAGGGSVVKFDGVQLKVGPGSAGSEPGPACYKRGGPLTITDCNLLLGFLNSACFPKCFGKDNNQPLDRKIVSTEFKKLIVSSNSQQLQKMNIYQVAEGFIKLANEKMANAIKKISLDKGYDVRSYSLSCYGGAAGQHCCDVADLLGVKEILINSNASVMSALGISLANEKKVLEDSVEKIFIKNEVESLVKKFIFLEEKIKNNMNSKSLDREKFSIKKLVNLKYLGSSEPILVELSSWSEMRQEFQKKFKSQFGFTEISKPITIGSILIEVIYRGNKIGSFSEKQTIDNSVLQTDDFQKVFEKGIWKQIPLIRIGSIVDRSIITGPAIVTGGHTTVVLKSGWEIYKKGTGDLILTKTAAKKNLQTRDGSKNNLLETTLFGNRLTAIAEQMGMVLKKTAASVNIKERNDFSCAIFDTAGNLLANAPHIPVHLGSMSDSVKNLLKTCSVKSGEVYLTNNPFNGGTHLPDITCITPVFRSIDSEISFLVASRGHHADIGGKTPGSMPAKSSFIEEEGVLINDMTIVRDGKFLETRLLDLFADALYPPRNKTQNIFDIKAQIAANQKGVEELISTIDYHGIEKIKILCNELLNQGKKFVQDAIKNIDSGSFYIQLDNGITITVLIKNDIINKKLSVEFNEIDWQQESNFNAPKAVTKACVLYVLRCLIEDDDIPLNEGFLFPIEIKIPRKSLLNPSYPAAVVAGNVETSQKIVDCLLGALGMQAGSQGTMNNFSFGNEKFQYYETICGGTGAGPNFNGSDATQSHMTNSRITDPEILEVNFPVLLRKFSIRKDCGGRGKYSGGNGVTREITFLEPMVVSILSNCRKVSPHGLNGGASGLRGENILITADRTITILESDCEFDVNKGDTVQINTPGGGGYGNPSK